ncbi:NPC intracellular cholesterol transporter 2-like [Microplitis mediator]|uniref:NPC intracellular cholesterol transporter 2-like n=1 Tax=Microplitis mediator TaxID=375433 RepID=UPI002555E071|nr:NPC intracellular cholesterol transporter 2-like [Microplitis mediator]
MLRTIFPVILSLLCLTFLTEAVSYDQCKDAKDNHSIRSLTISNCESAPCPLKRQTSVMVEETFVAKKNVKSLTTSVFAKVAAFWLPFVSVHNKNACDNIYNMDDSIAGCPLKAGTEYKYRNEFPILSIYPTLTLPVQWALKDKNDIITCFQVYVKITN